MNGDWAQVGIAIVGGMAITLQGQFMGLMDKGIGTVESVFITYAGGGLVAALVIIGIRGGNLGAWHHVPWYTLLSGLLGLLIVGAIGYSIPRLGLSKAFTIMIAAQFAVAAAIDHFGWIGAPVRPLNVSRLAGMAVLVLGVWLVTKS